MNNINMDEVMINIHTLMNIHIHINNINIYEVMKENKDKFDFSNYPFVHDNYSTENKRVPGKFKDECAGALIAEWIGLRAKCYCIRQIGKVRDNIWTKVGEFVDKKQ